MAKKKLHKCYLLTVYQLNPTWATVKGELKLVHRWFRLGKERVFKTKKIALTYVSLYLRPVMSCAFKATIQKSFRREVK